MTWRSSNLKKRSQNLGDAEIKQIVEILDGWSDKLSWELLIDVIELRIFNRYTRQALYKHERVRHAFELRKNELVGGGKNVKQVASPQLQLALERIARLDAENRRLESENNQLLEQFARRGLQRPYPRGPTTIFSTVPAFYEQGPDQAMNMRIPTPIGKSINNEESP